MRQAFPRGLLRVRAETAAGRLPGSLSQEHRTRERSRLPVPRRVRGRTREAGRGRARGRVGRGLTLPCAGGSACGGAQAARRRGQRGAGRAVIAAAAVRDFSERAASGLRPRCGPCGSRRCVCVCRAPTRAGSARWERLPDALAACGNRACPGRGRAKPPVKPQAPLGAEGDVRGGFSSGRRVGGRRPVRSAHSALRLLRTPHCRRRSLSVRPLREDAGWGTRGLKGGRGRRDVLDEGHGEERGRRRSPSVPAGSSEPGTARSAPVLPVWPPGHVDSALRAGDTADSRSGRGCRVSPALGGSVVGTRDAGFRRAVRARAPGSALAAPSPEAGTEGAWAENPAHETQDCAGSRAEEERASVWTPRVRPRRVLP